MPEREHPSIVIPEIISVKKLAETLSLPVPTIITELMKNGILATINEEIDYDTAAVIASDLGFEATLSVQEGTEALTLESLAAISRTEQESEDMLPDRPPVVTILGHVDHGKTTLLDAIRKTNVAGSEAGGITQRISAYQVKKHGKMITFIDTPGHEAFSGMRKRGVSIADIAILVVAADDGVRPQTKEVIAFIKERKLPVLVAINKIDKPEAKPDRVKQELAELGVLIEEWGGDVLATEISAKQGLHIDKLLDNILLVAEVERFRADEKRPGLAVVLESHLDPKKGPIAIALIRTGTLKVGQDVIAGAVAGRIRRLEDFAGRMLQQATPSVPVIVYGFSTTPQINDVIQVIGGKIAARSAAREALREGSAKRLAKKEDASERPVLPIVLKADVQGSLEAIEQILTTIPSDQAILDIVGTGVGNITESDIRLAESAHAVIYGFNVTPTAVAKRLAETSTIEIITFDIIYKLVETIKDRLVALLPPEMIRTDLGRLSVLAVFKTGKKDMIVGGRVSEGKIVRGTELELKRGEEILGRGKMGNLQQNKQNTDEVGQGNECGLVFDGPLKIQVGDTLICFKEEMKRRSL